MLFQNNGYTHKFPKKALKKNSSDRVLVLLHFIRVVWLPPFVVLLLDAFEWWGSQGLAEVMALKGRVNAVRMPRATPMESPLEAFLRGGGLLTSSWSFRGCIKGVRLALPG
jgi:hypothetical protein